MSVARPVCFLAAVGLLAGCATADRDGANDRADQKAGTPGRNAYSPEPTKDSYVIEQWAKTTETLERTCRETGEHCEEARAAREFLNAQ